MDLCKYSGDHRDTAFHRAAGEPSSRAGCRRAAMLAAVSFDSQRCERISMSPEPPSRHRMTSAAHRMTSAASTSAMR
eukprot:4998672-Prymnesium_polylepis.1